MDKLDFIYYCIFQISWAFRHILKTYHDMDYYLSYVTCSKGPEYHAIANRCLT